MQYHGMEQCKPRSFDEISPVLLQLLREGCRLMIAKEDLTPHDAAHDLWQMYSQLWEAFYTYEWKRENYLPSCE